MSTKIVILPDDIPANRVVSWHKLQIDNGLLNKDEYFYAHGYESEFKEDDSSNSSEDSSGEEKSSDEEITNQFADSNDRCTENEAPKIGGRIESTEFNLVTNEQSQEERVKNSNLGDTARAYAEIDGALEREEFEVFKKKFEKYLPKKHSKIGVGSYDTQDPFIDDTAVYDVDDRPFGVNLPALSTDSAARESNLLETEETANNEPSTVDDGFEFLKELNFFVFSGKLESKSSVEEPPTKKPRKNKSSAASSASSSKSSLSPIKRSKRQNITEEANSLPREKRPKVKKSLKPKKERLSAKEENLKVTQSSSDVNTKENLQLQDSKTPPSNEANSEDIKQAKKSAEMIVKNEKTRKNTSDLDKDIALFDFSLAIEDFKSAAAKKEIADKTKFPSSLQAPIWNVVKYRILCSEDHKLDGELFTDVFCKYLPYSVSSLKKLFFKTIFPTFAAKEAQQAQNFLGTLKDSLEARNLAANCAQSSSSSSMQQQEIASSQDSEAANSPNFTEDEKECIYLYLKCQMELYTVSVSMR